MFIDFEAYIYNIKKFLKTNFNNLKFKKTNLFIL